MSRTRIPDHTRQALILTNLGQASWLENVAGDDEITDEFHSDPQALLERKEEEERSPPET